MATTQTSRAKTKANGTTRARDDVSTDIDRLRADIAALSESVTNLGSKAADDAKSQAGEISHDVADAYQGVLDELRHELARIEKTATATVKNNPLQSVGIAAGIGFLVALMARH